MGTCNILKSKWDLFKKNLLMIDEHPKEGEASSVWDNEERVGSGVSI